MALTELGGGFSKKPITRPTSAAPSDKIALYAQNEMIFIA